MTPSHGSRTMAALVRELRRQGWRVRQGTHHWQCWPPDGGPRLTLSSQVPAGRAWRALLRDLRRAGIVSP